ncbi:hypothetical protein B0H19DRAFT_1086373 [Mycena capillaripes]|nr:hypothetical protein B0H19DRAFT_1086373 [Mycena capillaripes]
MKGGGARLLLQAEAYYGNIRQNTVKEQQPAAADDADADVGERRVRAVISEYMEEKKKNMGKGGEKMRRGWAERKERKSTTSPRQSSGGGKCWDMSRRIASPVSGWIRLHIKNGIVSAVERGREAMKRVSSRRVLQRAVGLVEVGEGAREQSGVEGDGGGGTGEDEVAPLGADGRSADATRRHQMRHARPTAVGIAERYGAARDYWGGARGLHWAAWGSWGGGTDGAVQERWGGVGMMGRLGEHRWLHRWEYWGGQVARAEASLPRTVPGGAVRGCSGGGGVDDGAAAGMR